MFLCRSIIVPPWRAVEAVDEYYYYAYPAFLLLYYTPTSTVIPIIYAIILQLLFSITAL